MRKERLLTDTYTRINRRQTLLVLGAGASLLAAGKIPNSPARAQTNFDCILSPEVTEGPYWVDGRLNRADIRANTSTGSVKAGTLLNLTINMHSVTSTACGVLPEPRGQSRCFVSTRARHNAACGRETLTFLTTFPRHSAVKTSALSRRRKQKIAIRISVTPVL